MIPANKQADVEHALQTAFGVSRYDGIKPITIGLSTALTYQIRIHTTSYLLKMARTDPLSTPANYYRYMEEAASAGIAPRVWYTNAQDGISITDYIEAKPFPVNKAKEILPKLLRSLHTLPPFHQGINYLDAMDGMVRRVNAAQLLPEPLNEAVMKKYTRIKQVYPNRPEEFVSSHNDLKPENMLFDGERAWLVDWEAAFLNDRYLDLAVTAHFVVHNEEESLRYLESYFGQAAGPYRSARFFLMQQLLHVFYASTFLLYAAKRVPIVIDQPVVSFRDYHNRIWNGEVDLADDGNKLQYAMVHLHEFLNEEHEERLAEALAEVKRIT